MSWWETISDSVSQGVGGLYDSASNAASSWYGGIIGEITGDPSPTTAAVSTGAVPVNVATPDEVEQQGGGLSGINWQIVGVVIAGLGLLLMYFRSK